MKRVMNIPNEEVYESAREEFVRLCRFNLEMPKHIAMYEDSLKTYERGSDGLSVQVLLAEYDNDIFDKGTIELEGATFKCNIMSRIEKENIEKIVFYIITVGECEYHGGDTLKDLGELLYSDMWGTAFVDASTAVFQEKLINEYGEEFTLSPTFGPGYFGLPTESAINLVEILEAESIGVSVKPSGFLIPQKSCSGFQFILKKNTTKFPSACLDCLGHESGCAYCKKQVS